MGLTLFKGKAMTFPWGKENSFEAIGYGCVQQTWHKMSSQVWS